MVLSNFGENLLKIEKFSKRKILKRKRSKRSFGRNRIYQRINQQGLKFFFDFGPVLIEVNSDREIDKHFQVNYDEFEIRRNQTIQELISLFILAINANRT